jgi:hypothetical protein
VIFPLPHQWSYAEFVFGNLHRLGKAMKHFADICLAVRTIAQELGGTLTLVFLIAFGVYKAWQEFIVKLFR